jgi:anti-sigma B factor antagonist
MPIRVKKKKGVSTLFLEGEMSIYNAAELKGELVQLLSQPGEYEIDLSGVSEMDSAGLQLLILAKREAARLKTILQFNGHSRAVLEVINLCNLAAYFGDPIWES